MRTVQPIGEGQEALLSLRGISKRFGHVQANREISLNVYPGEILGLLGENGAGKSTLMSILSGDYQPDAGEIWWKGQQVLIESPRDARALGIGMVHQHFTLIPELTVAENIVLGLKSSRPFFTDLGAARRRIDELSRHYGLEVDADAHVWQLSLGLRQRVEILKILYRGSRLLVLDEPTAVLTPQEVDQLLEMLVGMAAEGATIIFVSHKFREVRALCRRVVVLRSGQVVGDLDVTGVNDQDLARLVIGEEVSRATETPLSQTQTNPELFRVDSLSARNDLGLSAFSNVTFEVHAGEIVGVAGVAGNGQSELVECLAGLRPAATGTIYLAGLELTRCSPRQRRAAGLAHIPEDRRGVGCVLDFSLEENIILGEHYRPPAAPRGVLNASFIHRITLERLKTYRVKAGQPTLSARTLSGGNLQKLVLARELSSSPQLVLAAEPTRGLDVAAVEFTYQQFLHLRGGGKGVLLISSDLDEVLRLSDRIFVMHRGRLLGPLPRGIGRKEVGYSMLTGRLVQGGGEA
ncbi:MAG: ABC transporter ATP-binding protein [Anaerolineales bacterium]|jgi:ABC-type uncharacterized transport system ATPase subunit